MNLPNLKKEHLALILMGIAVIISIAFVVNYSLVIEAEKNLSRNELISKIRNCLEEKMFIEYWKPSNEATGDVDVRFVGLTKEEISDLATKYDIAFQFSYESTDGVTKYITFNMKKNLPTGKICNFLNDENVKSYSLQHFIHLF